jgi:diguanylate cyclase
VVDASAVKRVLLALYLILIAGMSIAYFALSPTPNTKLVLYNGVGLLSLLGTIVGIFRHRTSDRMPWVLFALGQTSFLTADLIYYWLETHRTEVPFPSVADGFYLSMYPLVIAGLTLKIRKNSTRTKDWAGLIDAGIFGIALFSVLWVLVMDSYVPIAVQATPERLISLCYPVMDLAVLFVAIRLAVGTQRRNRSLMLIIAALCSLVIADVQYGVLNAADAFQTGSIVDAFWLGFYVLFALAALLPSRTSQVRSESHQIERITNVRLGLMFLATLTVPFIDLVWGTPADRYVTLTSSAVLFALILGRVIGLVRTVEQGREQLHQEARQDPLTGLANRTQFTEQTTMALAVGANSVAVLMIDLDDFKAVNDSLGHEAGDQVLNEVSDRITKSIRDTDVVARLGGDEFAVLITKMIDRQDAANTASRIIRAMNEPISILDRQVRVGASVGVAVQSREHADVQSLLRGADVAMYLAKRQGKSRYEFFEQQQYSEIIDRLNLKEDLESALDQEQFVVRYQPIVDTDSAIIRSVEALLRWDHPVRGMISPSAFIPLAEESGKINAIGKWVLRETCKQVRTWQLTIPHCGELRASVNLSARQLHDPELLHTVTDALQSSGLAPEYLTLEVTESLLVADSNSTRTLQQLTALKVKIAIDDFGTGYSSLSYLHSFPVDTIKIDQSFVQKLDDSVTSHALVRTVIDLARAVGGTTVAEGVENQRQLDILSELNCDLVQGFLFSRPLPADEFSELLIGRNQKEQLLPLPAKSRAGAVHSGIRAEVIRGTRHLESTLVELEAFHRAVNAPITSRWSWLSSWFQLHPDAEVQCLLVRSSTGTIDAAALLARQRDGEVVRFFSVNNQSANVASIFARDDKSAEILAQGIADLVVGCNGRWTLELSQIAGDNRVAEALKKCFPHAETINELSVPQVLLTSGLTVDGLLSKNMRKQLRRVKTKLSILSDEWKVDFHRGTASIMALLPEIESIHISRDHAQRNESDLDDAFERRFWQETVVTHTYTDELELATLTINGSIAAYVISLVDGGAYRVLDGRMNGSFAEFSPGRILETATLERALADDDVEVFDWMTGVAPETILAVNHWQERSTFRVAVTFAGSQDDARGALVSPKGRAVDEADEVDASRDVSSSLIDA